MQNRTRGILLCSLILSALGAHAALADDETAGGQEYAQYQSYRAYRQKRLARLRQQALLAASSGAVVAAASSSSTPAEDPRLVCLRKVLDTRETAIATAFTNYGNNLLAALVARGDALRTALQEANGPKRRVSLQTAWKQFGFTWRDAGNRMRQLRADAWTGFRTDRIACGVTDTMDEEGSGPGMDSQF